MASFRLLGGCPMTMTSKATARRSFVCPQHDLQSFHWFISVSHNNPIKALQWHYISPLILCFIFTKIFRKTLAITLALSQFFLSCWKKAGNFKIIKCTLGETPELLSISAKKINFQFRTFGPKFLCSYPKESVLSCLCWKMAGNFKKINCKLWWSLTFFFDKLC